MKYLLLLVPILMVSCNPTGPDDAAPRAITESWFKNPQYVGTLPDGRVVNYVIRDMGSGYDHYIYFVDGSMTLNTREKVGKTTYQRVIVEIDGVKYVPVEDPNNKK